MRVQQAIAAVPIRMMKRGFFFVADQMLSLPDDKRLEMVARNRGIRAKEGESAAKPLSAVTKEGVIGKLIVDAVILLSANKQQDGVKILRAAAQAYKVDTDAIFLKVKLSLPLRQKEVRCKD